MELSQIEQALSEYQDPYLQTDLLQAKCIKDLKIDGDKVSLVLEFGFPIQAYQSELTAAVSNALTGLVTPDNLTLSIEQNISFSLGTARGRCFAGREKHHRHCIG